MALGLANKSPATGLSGFTRVDKPAPPFTRPLFGGGELALSDRGGRPVVINFWASWCPPCRDEAPILESLWRKHRNDVLFVGVNIQDAEGDARAYLEEFGITYPNVLDADGTVTVDYGVVGLPVTFFVNEDGIVARRWVGAVTQTQMSEWVEELASGVSPAGDTEGANLEEFFQFD